MQFFSLSSILWTSLLAGSLHYYVCLSPPLGTTAGDENHRSLSARSWAALHAVGWGVPGVCVAILASTGAFGFAGDEHCWILSDSRHQWMRFTLFTAPLCLSFVYNISVYLLQQV